MADSIINSGSGFYIGRKFDVQLSAELKHKNNTIFYKEFNGKNPGIVSATTNTILIPDHYFVTGEKLDYRYDGYDVNTTVGAVGIATTSIPGIGVTNKLPRTIYAVKINDREIKVASTLEKSLKRIPETLGIYTGIGNYHYFVGEKQNSRTLVTIDNIIQSPIISTAVTSVLLSNMPGVSDLAVLSGVTSFFSGDLIKINDEIMKINYVGLGDRNTILVRRPMLGSTPQEHFAGDVVTKLKGNFNVVDNTVYFPTPPFGRSPVSDPENRDPEERDYVGLETFSTFDGRVFLRSGFVDSNIAPYDKNYIFDDISTQFLGITTAAVLTSGTQNIAGFSTGNAVVLVNNVFQTPDFIDYGLNESLGITTIYFTGTENRTDEDINTSSIPRGGIIISIASTEGFGYQPLISAGGTSIVSLAGTIQSVSIGNTGSGYRAPIKYEYETKVSTNIPANTNVITLNDTNGLFYSLSKVWSGSNVSIEVSDKISKCSALGIGTTSITIPLLSVSDEEILEGETVLITVDYPKIGLANVYVQSGSSVGIPTAVHIGVSTITNGRVSDVKITNSGIGFTNYLPVAEYVTNYEILTGSTEIPLNKLSGITTSNYISVGVAVTNARIVGVGSTAVTIQNPISVDVLEETSATIKIYDNLELIFDDPLSYNDLWLEYSKDSPSGGIGTYAKVNVTVGQGSSVINFEITNAGYSYGQGEILTVPTGGITGIPTSSGITVVGISTEVGILTGSRTTQANSDEFGSSIAVNYDATKIAIGAVSGFTSTSPTTKVGAVYVFDRSGSTFTEVGILTGKYALDTGDFFGRSVSMSSNGSTIAVGAPIDEIGGTTGTGVVYIYDRVGNNFTGVGTLSGTLSVDLSDRFGYSVDMDSSGNVIVVGAINDEDPLSGTNSGVTYVFERVAGPTFNQIGILTGYYASNSLDNYGNSIAISDNGKTIVVGAINDEVPGSGTESGVVYVYDKNGSLFTQVGILTGSLSSGISDNFGQTVCTNYDGRIIAVGAPNDSVNGNGAASGLIYIFEKTGSSYKQIQVLTGDFATNAQDNFGYSISMTADGNVITVGANQDEFVSSDGSSSSGSSSGVVYVYERRRNNLIFNDDYVKSGIITSYYANKTNDKFGSSLALSAEGKSLVVGAPFDYTNSSGGHSYVFDLDVRSAFREFQIVIDKTFTDEFSGWTFGDLTVFDSIDRLFNGRRKVFPLRKGGKQTTVRTRAGSPIELRYNLLIFLNDIYQVPGVSYNFNGGSFLSFTEPPQEGDKCIIVFYSGTTEVDTRFVDILETIKVGDEITLNDTNESLQQIPRTVTQIKATDVVNTNIYPGPGVSLDPQYQRPVTWCKQTEDKIIDGQIVGKDRTPIEPLIYPKTKIIQSVGIGSTEVIFVENLKTFFDSNNEYEDLGIIKRPQKKIILISNDPIGVATATASVNFQGRVSSIILNDGGVGYTTVPDVSVARVSVDPGISTGFESGDLIGIVTSYQSLNYIFERDIVGNNPNFTITVGRTLTLVINTPGNTFFIQSVPSPFSPVGVVSEGISRNGLQQGILTWTPQKTGTYYYVSQNTPAMTGTINVVRGPSIVDYNVRATATANISNGSVTSIDIVNPGLGYTNIDPPLVIISPPEMYYEKIEQVEYVGDFGWITGIATTSIPGIANTGLIFDFFIPFDSFLRDDNIVTTDTTVSGIASDYYFVLRNSNIGDGLNSLRKDGSIVSYGSSFIDNVYQATKVSIAQTVVAGYGVTTVKRVVVPVENYNGLGNISTYGSYYGDFSWGLIYDLKRSVPKSFSFYNIQNENLSGISSSADVIRINPLKYDNYTGILTST